MTLRAVPPALRGLQLLTAMPLDVGVEGGTNGARESTPASNLLHRVAEIRLAPDGEVIRLAHGNHFCLLVSTIVFVGTDYK